MKKCSWCGRESDDASAQCGECGTPFQTDERRAADGSYEFSQDHDRIISGLAFSMRIVGFVMIVLGCLQAIAGAVSGLNGVMGLSPVSAVCQGVIGLVLGVLTMKAGTAFGEIVATKGDDIGHLMDAFAALGRLYRIQVVILVVAGIVIVFALMAALLSHA